MNALIKTLDGLAGQWSEEPMSGCWIWIGNRTGSGYGTLYDGGRKLTPAHRVVYELARGPIPAGLQLDHLCRLRPCVNPAHLEPVTQGENIRRGMSPTIVASRTNICLRGHSLENAYRIRSGRQCRVCIHDRNVARSAGGPGFRKLTAEQVVEIRQRLANGERPYRLAAEYGVVGSTIRWITLGRSWRTV